MNKLQITGNIGKDAVVSDVNGWDVINFSVGVNKKTKEGQTTVWVDCSWWKKKGELNILPYLKKGTKVLVEGEASAGIYSDKKTGETKSKLCLNVRELELLGGNANATEPAQPTAQQALPVAQEPEDDLPF